MTRAPRILALLCVLLAFWSASCGNVSFGDPDALGFDTTAPDAGDASTDTDTEPAPAPLEPVFEPQGTHFFSMPWPADFRRGADGRLDMDGFPGTRGNDLLKLYLAELGQLRGFSVAPVIYLPFAGPLDPALLPDAAATRDPASPVQLVRVDEAGCGERVPVVANPHPEQDRYLPRDTLTVRPVPGFWLEPGGQYAALVTRELGAQAGTSTLTPPAFAELLARDPAYAPLRDCAAQAGIDLEQLAVATVFTVQDIAGELRAIRRQVIDPERTPAPTLSDWRHVPELDQPERFRTYFADYQTPIYQEGQTPYDTLGGFVFDASGEPVLQRWESVPMTVLVPVTAPPGPRPVLVWIDGTGSSRTGHLGLGVVAKALDAGFVVASFVPQMHEGRGVEGSDPVMHSFNYFNPTSGRCVFRQQAIDTSYFVRVVREGLPGLPGLPELDGARLVYGGHSQGAIVGGIVAGIESQFLGYVLNGIGGWLSVTVEERKDPFDVAATLATFFSVPTDHVTVEHPIVQLAQTGADVVDPHAYAADWLGHADNPSGVNVLLINGEQDHTTFPRSMNALTIRGDVAVLAPAGWDVDPYAVWDREPVAGPLRGNRTALDGTARTLAEVLSAEHGHYTLHDVPALQDMAVRFWFTALDGAPVVAR